MLSIQPGSVEAQPAGGNQGRNQGRHQQAFLTMEQEIELAKQNVQVSSHRKSTLTLHF